jgi:hypothetical protein
MEQVCLDVWLGEKGWSTKDEAMYLLNLTPIILLKQRWSQELILTHGDNLAINDLKQDHLLSI